MVKKNKEKERVFSLSLLYSPPHKSSADHTSISFSERVKKSGGLYRGDNCPKLPDLNGNGAEIECEITPPIALE